MTTTFSCCILAGAFLFAVLNGGCSNKPKTEARAEPEALSRTEFTSRVENYFEYEPLKAGKASQFRIHLTDLSDGTPVEGADVTLTARPKSPDAPIGRTTARIGKAPGIYVADLTIPNSGDYDIEFRIKNTKLDERMSLHDFKVERGQP